MSSVPLPAAEPLSVLTAMLRLQLAVARFDRGIRAGVTSSLTADERLGELERRWSRLDLSSITRDLDAAAKAADELLREGKLT